MARVTVEDCILVVPNRFDLVAIAAQRAKQIAAGNPLTLERDNDKDAVVALREVAEHTVSPETLREEMVQSFCKRHAMEVMEQPDKLPAPAQPSSDVQEAFAEAGHGIHEEGDAGQAPGGLSFVDENVQAED